jgi:hypothetical protein
MSWEIFMTKFYTLDELEEMSREAEAKLDVVFKVLRVKERREQAANDNRRSSSDEKVRINAEFEGIEAMFRQNPSTEVNVDDVLSRTNVRANQGNRSRIRHKIRQLQLTYRRAAE